MQLNIAGNHKLYTFAARVVRCRLAAVDDISTMTFMEIFDFGILHPCITGYTCRSSASRIFDACDSFDEAYFRKIVLMSGVRLEMNMYRADHMLRLSDSCT